MVILIFSIPVLMAALPLRLEISFITPGHFSTAHQNADSHTFAHEL
jgi:hypothetical protein